MISEIVLWVKNPKRTYEEGVRLYDKHGSLQVFKDLFLAGETDFSENKLYVELKKMADSFKGAEKPKVKTAEISGDYRVHSSAKHEKTGWEQLPERIKFLTIRKAEIFNEALANKHQIDFFPETDNYNEQRKILLKENERLFDIIDAIWIELDYFRDHNELMPEKDWLQITDRNIPVAKTEEDFKSLKPVELMKKEQSLMSSRSRAKKAGKDVSLYDIKLEQIRKLLL
jgi:hypothetical protein